MDLSQMDVSELLATLDGQRIALNLSYQNIADACDVSQTTIIRIFKGQTEPTFAMLQKIAVAVKYEPKQEPIALSGFTQEDYIRYLQQTVEAEKAEQREKLAQQEAHYNMLLNQKNRTIKYLSAVLLLFALGFIGWLIVDVTHPHIGWIQREAAYFSEGMRNMIRAVTDWLGI